MSGGSKGVKEGKDKGGNGKGEGKVREAPALQFQTRNSSEEEIANVNFLYDDIVHALQNTIDSCINSATDRRGYVFEHRFTNNAMQRPLRRSRSFKVADIGTIRKHTYRPSYY